MSSTLLLLTAAAMTGGNQNQSLPAHDAAIQRCMVRLIEEVDVPAQEAGVLVSMEAKEGDQVSETQFLAQINAEKPMMQKSIAEAELRKAQIEATNDVRERYAVASHEVDNAEYSQAINLANRLPDSVTEGDLRRLRLKTISSKYQIKQARMEQDVAKATEEVKQVELQAADKEIERRKVTAPLEGTVVEVLKHRGEWVNPGDTVMRIVRMNRLYVEGYVNAAEYGPGQIAGRRVEVTVLLEPLPNGQRRVEKFAGHITYVSPIVEGGGLYLVRAEVRNEREPDGIEWILRAGLPAEMVVKLSEPKFLEGVDRQ